MTDEKSILEQFAAGNHTAFRELFMRYHLKVYYFVLGLVKSESDGSPDKPGGLSIQLCKSEKKEFYIRYSS